MTACCDEETCACISFFIYTMNYVGSEIAYPDFTAPNCVGMV